jgi:hypothetical protein
MTRLYWIIQFTRRPAMETYDGNLYRDQDTIRRLLPLIETAAREGNALLVLACAAELIDRVGGRTAQLEVRDFLRDLRFELAPENSDQDRALLTALAPLDGGASG